MAFCKNCGTQLNEQGVCPNCAPSQNVQEPVAANAQAEAPQASQAQQVPNQNYQQPGFNQQAPNQNYQQPNFNQQAPNQNYQQPNFNQQAPYQNYQQQPAGPTFVDKVKNFIFNTKDETGDIDPADVAENKSLSWIAYLGILFFVPIVAKPTSKYSRFHANQGLLTLIFCGGANIVWIIISAILGALIRVPVYSGYYSIITKTHPAVSIITGIIATLISLVSLGIMALGIYNAATGKAKELPLIGKFRILKTNVI